MTESGYASWADKCDAEIYKVTAVFSRLVDDVATLAEALEPFVLHNSSEETITITVRTADVAKARAALKRIQGES